MKLNDYNGNIYDTKDSMSPEIVGHECIGFKVLFEFNVPVAGPLLFKHYKDASDWLDHVRKNERNNDTPNP